MYPPFLLFSKEKTRQPTTSWGLHATVNSWIFLVLWHAPSSVSFSSKYSFSAALLNVPPRFQWERDGEETVRTPSLVTIPSVTDAKYCVQGNYAGHGWEAHDDRFSAPHPTHSLQYLFTVHYSIQIPLLLVFGPSNFHGDHNWRERHNNLLTGRALRVWFFGLFFHRLKLLIICRL